MGPEDDTQAVRQGSRCLRTKPFITQGLVFMFLRHKSHVAQPNWSQTQHVAKAGLELILLPLPSKHWNYRHVELHLTKELLRMSNSEKPTPVLLGGC